MRYGCAEQKHSAQRTRGFGVWVWRVPRPRVLFTGRGAGREVVQSAASITHAAARAYTVHSNDNVELLVQAAF